MFEILVQMATGLYILGGDISVTAQGVQLLAACICLVIGIMTIVWWCKAEMMWTADQPHEHQPETPVQIDQVRHSLPPFLRHQLGDVVLY